MIIATVQVAVPVPVPRLFDYLPSDPNDLPSAGSRVLVPFGRRMLVGLVVGPSKAEDATGLKKIDQVLDDGLIDSSTLRVASWAVRYYCCPPGELVNLLLPPALRRNCSLNWGCRWRRLETLRPIQIHPM